MISKFILFLLGGLATLGFAPHYFVAVSILSWFGLFLSLKKSTKNFWNGYVFGAGYFVFGLSWITNALTIDAYTAEHFSWLIPFVYLGSGLIMGLFFAVPTWLAGRHKKPLFRLWSFPFYFITFEWMRGWILTGLPWNRLGAIWVDTPIILQSVNFFGILGLSFFTLIFILILFQIIYTKKRFSLLFPAGIAILGIIFYGNYKLKTKTKMSNVSIKLIQSGLSQKTKWSRSELEKNFQLHLDLSRTGKKTDIIIWSESAVAFDLAHNTFYRKQVENILENNQKLITGFIFRGEKTHNSVGVFSKKGLENVYHKHHLVPFGEYIPFANFLPLETIARGVGGLSAGEGAKTLLLENLPSVAPVICYESIFSGEIIDKKNPPKWILIITNDAWYGLSRGPYQHLAEAQIRAVEENLPVVRVAYNGISSVIDSKGKILISAPLQTRAVIDSFLPK
ncbi:MAG: apolipoprotein N-acyltransferase [Alphaproteobacteria bacterium]|nr:MAG: apolipoprotein N-acyltransferase [Rickettsiaceae bacterium 4572_127]